MKPLIVSFSQSNYITEPHGVEKYIMELTTIYKFNGLDYLHFFSFSDFKVKNYVGVLYNNDFMGLFHYKELISITRDFENKYNSRICCIHLQHLLNHKLSIISDYIIEFDVPVYLFVHDYYLLCNSYNFMNTDNVFCGVEKPCLNKCKNCGHWKKESKHIESIEKFIECCLPYLKHIIVPSRYVYDVFVNCWNKYKDYLIIRPHLICDGNVEYKAINNLLKIAFVGEQTEKKGFNYFEQLAIDLADNSQYKIFYLGIGEKNISNVENIYVSIAEQGTDAMKHAVEKADICLAYLWSVCPETYSYVYYELLSKGVFIITNENSGNVAAMVKEYNNGKVFNNYKESLEWLSDTKNVVKEVNDYRTKSGYKPSIIRNNVNIENIVPDVDDLQELFSITEHKANKRKVKSCKLLSYIYRRIRYD